jgi:hypothetical protein
MFEELRVPIPKPSPGNLPDGPTRDFVEAIHDLYDKAGRPSVAGLRVTTDALLAEAVEPAAARAAAETLERTQRAWAGRNGR